MSQGQLGTTLRRKLTKPESVYHLAERLKNELIPLLRDEGKCLEIFSFDYPDIALLSAEVEKKLSESMEKSQAPLRVSMIGQFNAGKTSTLSALVNRVRTLSRANVPTTGNVVEIQVMPPGKNGHAQQMKCSLFSQFELEEMLRDYYTWLGKNEGIYLSELPEQEGFLYSKIGELRLEVHEQLRQRWLQANRTSDAIMFGAIKKLAHLYFILMTMERYFMRFPEIVEPHLAHTLMLPYDPNQESTQRRLTTLTVLDMEWGLSDLHPDELDKLGDRFWQQVPDTFAGFQSACAEGKIEDEGLRALFPLYKRIILMEEMDLPGGWGDLQRLSFLDFPGIDSGSRRDIFLCLKELDTAHTNMIFLLANHPAVERAQALLELIAEAKRHEIDLHDRLIPIINFFDTFSGEIAMPNEGDTPELALKRVEAFFEKEIAPGVRRGFGIFDPTILGYLPLTGDWEYHLLTPVAALDGQTLSSQEQQLYRNYEENRDKYGQLIKDTQTAVRELRKKREGVKDAATIQEKIVRYDRLHFALQAYLVEGGISYLREQISAKLKQKGGRLIAEDARIPLIAGMEQVEQKVIHPLEQESLEVDNPDTLAHIAAAERRTQIITLWKQMEQLTREWTRQGTLVELGATNDEEEQAALSPLLLCERRVLNCVLSNPFWTQFNVHTPPPETSLKDLVTSYQRMVEELMRWSENALQQAVRQTLERLDRTPLVLESGEKVSFQNLAEKLFHEHVQYSALPTDDKKNLRDLFSLQSEQGVLTLTLHQLWQAQEAGEEAVLQTQKNEKVPFNEDGTLTWSPMEVMKLQRQLIITLQRKISRPFAFYISVFFPEFAKLLGRRLDAPENLLLDWFTRFDQPHGVFDQLAQITQAEGDDSEEVLGLRQRREKGKEVATRIVQLWHELVE